jgi:hypothetical protein
MTTFNGFPVMMPMRRFEFNNIDGSQAAALWRGNAFHNGNDEAIQRILNYLEQRYGLADAVLQRIRGVREDGTFVGTDDEMSVAPLIPSKNSIEMIAKEKTAW